MKTIIIHNYFIDKRKNIQREQKKGADRTEPRNEDTISVQKFIKLCILLQQLPGQQGASSTLSVAAPTASGPPVAAAAASDPFSANKTSTNGTLGLEPNKNAYLSLWQLEFVSALSTLDMLGMSSLLGYLLDNVARSKGLLVVFNVTAGRM